MGLKGGDHIRAISPKNKHGKPEKLTQHVLDTQEVTAQKHVRAVGEAFKAICEKLGIPPVVTV